MSGIDLRTEEFGLCQLTAIRHFFLSVCDQGAALAVIAQC